MQGVLALVPLGAVCAVAVMAALCDWRHRRLPHWPAASLAAVWVVAAVAAPDLLGGPPLAGTLCGALALVVGVALRSAGWLGSGDVKLAAALGLWLGPVEFGLALVAAGALTLLLVGSAFAVGGDFARRGLPLACALAPPAAVLLLWRAAELAGSPDVGA